MVLILPLALSRQESRGTRKVESSEMILLNFGLRTFLHIRPIYGSTIPSTRFRSWFPFFSLPDKLVLTCRAWCV